MLSSPDSENRQPRVQHSAKLLLTDAGETRTVQGSWTRADLALQASDAEDASRKKESLYHKNKGRSNFMRGVDQQRETKKESILSSTVNQQDLNTDGTERKEHKCGQSQFSPTSMWGQMLGGRHLCCAVSSTHNDALHRARRQQSQLDMVLRSHSP